MNKENLRKYGVITFIVIGILFFVYEKLTADKFYEGEAKGFADMIKVKVYGSKDGDKFNISKIEHTHSDTPEIANSALATLSDRIVKENSTDVDIVAGATFSSNGFLEAVNNAVKVGMGNSTENVEKTDEVKSDKGEFFEGKGQGLSGTVKVKVYGSKNGDKLNITDIEYSHVDTPSIADHAMKALTEKIIELQNIEVDIVAGASAASRGFLTAVKEAVSKMPDSKEVSESSGAFFEGEAQGFSAPIVVKVYGSKEGDKLNITKIEYTHEDTPAIADPALETLTQNIIDSQSVEVDIVAGASLSSNGFIEAVKDAISKMSGSKVESDEIIGGADGPTNIFISDSSDTFFEGEAQGFVSTITVKVYGSKEEDKLNITKIEYTHHDTPAIADPALETLTQNIIDSQSVEVDIIAGASLSSNGFLEAVKDALSKTKVSEGSNQEAKEEEKPVQEDPRGKFYTGEGKGFEDSIISVKVLGSKDGDKLNIKEIDYTHSDTPAIADPALLALAEKIILEDRVDIDIIAGATFSSNGFLEAVRQASENIIPFELSEESK